MPVQASTTSATSSGPTSSLTIGASSPASRGLGGRRLRELVLDAGMSSVEQLGRAAEVAVALGALGLDRAAGRARSLRLADPVEARPSPAPTAR